MTMPLFGKIVCKAFDEGVPDRCFEIKGHGVKDKLLYIKPNTFSDGGVTALVPNNSVQCTKDKEEATATIAWITPDKGKIFGKDTVPASLKFPIIQNKVALSVGDEIKLFSEPKVASGSQKSLSFL